MPRDHEFDVIPLSQVPREDQKKLAENQLILIVDDEQVIADTLSIILSRNGYSVLTAYDGANALKLAQATPPDLLLSDVVMPGMSGIELAIALREAAPNCRVLLFSGQASTVNLLADARNAGRDFNVLSKPIHPADLLRSISGVFAPTDERVTV
jgi:CheY-like chemotaxis protein